MINKKKKTKKNFVCVSLQLKKLKYHPTVVQIIN